MNVYEITIDLYCIDKSEFQEKLTKANDIINKSIGTILDCNEKAQPYPIWKVETELTKNEIQKILVQYFADYSIISK